MNNDRVDIKGLANSAHALGLFGVDFGGAPHTRAGGEELEGVGADFAGAFDGFGGAAGCAQVDADSLGHGSSLDGRC